MTTPLARLKRVAHRSPLPLDALGPALVREVVAIRREARTHTPRPPATGLVLEIGAGQSPQPRTSVVVDKYVVDDFERPGEQAMSFEKPLVVADGEALPFADGAFAYVVALHVLEHAPRPTVMADEMARVGAAGFVQVPSRRSEVTFGWAYHPWLIDKDADGTLVFAPREDAAAPIGEDLHRMYGESPLMRLWWSAHRSTWHHSVPWSGTLPVRVLGESAAAATADFDHERTVAVLRGAHASGRTRPLPPEIRAALRCPACRGALDDAPNALRCAPCDRPYVVAGDVPVLV